MLYYTMVDFHCALPHSSLIPCKFVPFASYVQNLVSITCYVFFIDHAYCMPFKKIPLGLYRRRSVARAFIFNNNTVDSTEIYSPMKQTMNSWHMQWQQAKARFLKRIALNNLISGIISCRYDIYILLTHRGLRKVCGSIEMHITAKRLAEDELD